VRSAEEEQHWAHAASSSGGSEQPCSRTWNSRHIWNSGPARTQIDALREFLAGEPNVETFWIRPEQSQGKASRKQKRGMSNKQWLHANASYRSSDCSDPKIPVKCFALPVVL
jgi:hypothetical protein